MSFIQQRLSRPFLLSGPAFLLFVHPNQYILEHSLYSHFPFCALVKSESCNSNQELVLCDLVTPGHSQRFYPPSPPLRPPGNYSPCVNEWPAGQQHSRELIDHHWISAQQRHTRATQWAALHCPAATERTALLFTLVFNNAGQVKKFQRSVFCLWMWNGV